MTTPGMIADGCGLVCVCPFVQSTVFTFTFHGSFFITNLSFS